MMKDASGRNSRQPVGHGPSLTAIPFLHGGTGLSVPILSPDEQRRLALIATIAHFPRGAVLFEENQEVRFIYNIVQGAVKTYHVLEDGSAAITAFLFPEDLVGLAEDGRYVDTAEAVEPVTAYRLPIEQLGTLLRGDAELEMHFLCKVCHELRAAQRHTILLTHRRARAKIVLFLHLIEAQAAIAQGSSSVIKLPMQRRDIASYLGLSIEAVSRALHELKRDGILRFGETPATLQIIDRPRFEKLIRLAA
jgi:CRP-like cAMP-binding protein